MRTMLVLATGLLCGTGGTAELIDRRIAERWAADGLRPAAPADDYEFLRRLSLDLRGVIPTPEEARAFAADRDGGKREKIVDAWLRGDEFARFWARRWADDLSINPALKQKFRGLHDAYEGWLRDAIRANMPYDRFARRLLTAKGPLDLDPAAGFLMAGLTQTDAGAKDVVERVARVFLGTQIRCAECHDHPFDDWTQQDFYGMAGFFWQSRADVKSGKGMGELDGRVVDDPEKGEPFSTGGKEKSTYAVLYKASGKGPSEREPRRAAFARLLADDPQFARAAVNRHWGMLVGRGIVHPLDGFSKSRKPSHPELLDELAADFARSGYDVRRLMKSILLSKPYQLSSRQEGGERRSEKAFARAVVTPMTTDQLFESFLRATGYVDGKFSPNPKDKMEPRSVREAFMREFRPPFELDDPFAPPSEATIAQALYFLNGELAVRATSAAPALRLGKVLDREREPARRVEELFLAALGRPPSSRESSSLLEKLKKKGDSREAYEDLFWALINSTEFVTRH
jgi:hypothetical protein